MMEEKYNAGTKVLATVWALTATAVVVMALRVLAKVKISHFNIDDVVMIIALVCGTYSFQQKNGLILLLCYCV